jgi:hypothetical protein
MVLACALTSGGAPSVCFVYRTTTPASSWRQHCTFHQNAPHRPISDGLDPLLVVVFLDEQILSGIFLLSPMHIDLTTRIINTAAAHSNNWT